MKFFPYLICFLMLILSGCGPRANEDLKELDKVLESKSEYESRFLEKISMIHTMYSKYSDLDHQYDKCMALADAFSAYSSDSTFRYLAVCQKIASHENDEYKSQRADFALAMEYVMAGYYVESSDILSKYKYADVHRDLLTDYFLVRHKLAGELKAFTSDNKVRITQLAEWDSYRDSLFMHLEPYSYDWYDMKREYEEEKLNYDMARKYAMEMIKLSDPVSREYSTACYFYQFYLSDQNGAKERIEWLCKAAESDIKCSIKDNAALNTLSVLIFSQGDVDRAFRYYAEHCMPDALFFNGKLRPWQISQVFPIVEQAYQQKQLERGRKTTWVVACAIFLLIVIIFLLLLMIHHQNKLNKVNARLKEADAKVNEYDKVKEAYIAEFLSRISEDIEKERKYRNHVLKYLKRGEIEYLISEIEKQPPIEEDIQKFYKMFDETFISLYPDFIDKFNALLADGEQITPKEGEILTTELRIYALIKLGISDSGKIASLLHYSANTIYNYRSKIRNKSKVDRDKFDDYIRDIS
jgi:hypothetical protein